MNESKPDVPSEVMESEKAKGATPDEWYIHAAPPEPSKEDKIRAEQSRSVEYVFWQ
jgi:hypothetical protein